MPVKLIHITDIYHPHADPDDHYDLSQIFALSKMGEIKIEQVIIDYPSSYDYGSPAICAVDQLNYLTNSNVQVTIGASVHEFRGKPQLWKSAEKNKVGAAEKIIEILDRVDVQANEMVFINIAGGCLDTAIALERSPEIFKDKCAGIVLNAGTSFHRPGIQEYNVALGALEYSKIFSAPCPVYWSPCYEKVVDQVGSYGTYYRFLQGEVFKQITKPLLNYFMYMLAKSQNSQHLDVLVNRSFEKGLIEEFCSMYRNMWCTGPIFSIAGKTVTIDGEIVPKGDTDKPVYEYEPIKITCTPDGVTEWEYDNLSAERFIFRVNDLNKYETAMFKALTTVLKEL
jgi:hypothetical protein